MNKQALLNIMKTRKGNKRKELIRDIKYLINELSIQLERLEMFEDANVNSYGIVQNQGKNIDNLCKELNMLNNKKAELLDTNLAFDNEIMQKILPRIQGSSASIKDMLCELFKKCAGDYTGLSQASVSEQMQVYVETKDCKYKKSAEKICYMMRRFEEDGFTSYWL